MDARHVREHVEMEMETELNRLGSDKVLLAATGANLSTDAVLGVVYDGLHRHHTRLTDWGMDTPRGELATAFKSAAASVASIRGLFSQDDETGSAERQLLRFDDPETPCERAGAGLIAGPLILDRLGLQAVSFFVNEAAQERADRCRKMRASMGTIIDESLSAIDEECGEASAMEAVQTGATRTIQESYGMYAETLQDMGLDPKPVC